MSDTTTPADLTIPPAAVAAHFVCGCSESGVRAGYKPEALGPIVAAELRRIAEDGTGWAIATHLRARADELDGGAQ